MVGGEGEEVLGEVLEVLEEATTGEGGAKVSIPTKSRIICTLVLQVTTSRVSLVAPSTPLLTLTCTLANSSPSYPVYQERRLQVTCMFHHPHLPLQLVPVMSCL